MSGMFLKAVDTTGGPERFEIPEGRDEIDVGRSSECAIVLMSKSVSRVHARFQRRGPELLVEDLGSSNGTTVNGTRIQEAVTVRAGDRIRFGSLEFVLEASAVEREAETLLASSSKASTATADAPPPIAPPPVAPPTIAPPTVAPPAVAASPGRPAPVTTPASRQAEPTARTLAQPAKDPSPLELALIASAAYLTVVAMGFALRWLGS